MYAYIYTHYTLYIIVIFHIPLRPPYILQGTFHCHVWLPEGNCLLSKFEIIRGQDGSKPVFQAGDEKVTTKECDQLKSPALNSVEQKWFFRSLPLNTIARCVWKANYQGRGQRFPWGLGQAPMGWIPSGSQTWLAGKSSMYRCVPS